MHLRFNKIIIGGLLLIAQNALASGYEIPINLGGRAAGLSGIGTPYAQGSEALYFNPAGLAREKMATDLSVYATPLMAKFNQPGYESEDMWAAPFGIMYAMSLNEDWGFGIGFYTAAGAMAHYKNVSATGPAGQTDNLDENTNLAVGELALGAGYRVNDRLKLGVAYRIDFAKANFKTISEGTTGAIVNVGVKDLTDTQFEGFKIGAQYKFGEKTLVGLTYRSPIFFEATGNFEGAAYAGNSMRGSVDGNGATAKTVLPEAITLGASSEMFDHWNIMAEYAWTQYSRVYDIGVDGNFAVSGQHLADHLSIMQNWKDQHNVRVAGEYVGYSWPIRFGYQWTSQVTDSQWARGTFAPPAALHTFAVGTGAWLASGLKLDGGLNYTFGGGDNNMNPAANKMGGPILRNGNFDVEEYALNLELMYAF